MSGRCSRFCAAVRRPFAAVADADLRRYRGKRPIPRTRLLRDAVLHAGGGESLLDIGAGIGALVGADDRILGAAVLGIEGGEIASMLQIAMMGGPRWQDLRDAIFPHPRLAQQPVRRPERLRPVAGARTRRRVWPAVGAWAAGRLAAFAVRVATVLYSALKRRFAA